MRRTWLVGAGLVVAALVAVVLSSLLDLELESVVLLGLAVGAIVALVPDGSPLMRLVGAAAGLVVAWVAYLLRAGFLPDSTSGRVAALAVVLVVCVLVAGLTQDRVPLWSTLLGAAALAGAYEYTYAAAPPEVVTTSMSSVTSLLVTAALGYLVVALIDPQRSAATTTRPTPGRPTGTGTTPSDSDTSLDDMMETSR